MSRELELLEEIRDLLAVIAEPAVEKRDAKQRASLREVVGKSRKRAAAVGLMDGSRTQAAIVQQAAIDKGQLSKMVKALGQSGLVSADTKHPTLVLRIPANFFDETDDDQ